MNQKYPNILRPKKYGSKSKNTGNYRRKQINYCEKRKNYLDDNYLISMPNSYTFQIFDYSSKKLLSHAHIKSFNSILKINLLDSNTLMTRCQDNSLQLWNTQTGSKLYSAENIDISAVPAIKDSRFFLIKNIDGNYVSRDLITKKTITLSNKFLLLLNFKRKFKIK